MFDEFKSGQYYPVNIGDVYESKYQVLGKLGFGSTSTVWLARHLQEHSHVALKVYTREGADNDEFEMYGIISKANPSHPGYGHVRTALDRFVLQGPSGDHPCLVQKPMWDSWRDFLFRNPTHRFTEDLLKAGLTHVLLALDYLHTECKIVHTDIKADNILQEIVDNRLLDEFTQAELQMPSPRKFVNGAPVYMSRRFGIPRKFGGVVLSDFGAAVRGNLKRNHSAQPNVYRSPEVMLKAAWSYPADIWNLGAMIWDVYEDKHMFYGQDPKENKYMTRAHLAEVTGMLGLAPLDLVQRGVRSKEFFTEDGKWKADVPIPEGMSLEASEENLEGENKRMFLNFMRGMLQWRPEDRKTAKELLDDPWLNSPSSEE
ncbi:kinase-like domain-containing protein [Cercophora scortea]|uniref:non-specific serine/threonine protein kinase n=1 Tax=Cercophora scortea TaxID=314031 RepID=A0AAE0IG43_9PEZI|nr:kinase-like domain-containing protein [Cercophora scortea]